MSWVNRAVWALIFAGVLLVGAHALPLGATNLELIKRAKTPDLVVLTNNQTLEQTLKLPVGQYSGLSLYVESAEQVSTTILATLRDETGIVLASGTSAKAVYESDDRLIRFDIPWRWFSIDTTTPATLSLTTTSHEPLALKASPTDELDVYTPGSTHLDGIDQNQDIALTFKQPAPLPFGAKQGSLAAVLFILGLVLIWRIPNVNMQWWAAAGLLAAVTPVVLLGYWYSSGSLGVADWDYYFSLHNHYRDIIVTHHQFPLWNPYTCGGTAALGDPEFPGITLTFLLELIFGIPTGVRLAIFLATFGGAAGMLALARRLNLSLPAGVAASLIAFFGTVNLLEITEGHVNVFAASWIPWIFWAWLGAYRYLSQSTAGRVVGGGPRIVATIANWRVIVLGIFLAATFLQGGIYLLMYTTLAFITLIFLVKNPWAAIRTTGAAALWALGLAAFKLLPVLAWLKQFPDDAYAGSAYTVPWLLDILVGRHLHGEYLIFNQMTGWHEYGAYIGFTALGLAILGLSYFGQQRVVRGLLAAVVLAGGISALGPALVPLFDQLWFFPRSSVSRFIFFAVIPLGLLAGYGLERMRSFGPKARFLSWLAVGIIALELFSLTYQLSEQAFILPPVLNPPAPPAGPIAFTPDRYDAPLQGDRFTRSFVAAEAGYGTFVYCSVLGPDPRVRTIYDEGANEAAFVDAPEATWKITSWKPDRVSLTVDTPSPGLVALNTNYVEGWRASKGELTQLDGRVATRVEAGRHDITFRYHPPGLPLGLGITTLTLVVVGYVIHTRRRDQRKNG